MIAIFIFLVCSVVRGRSQVVACYTDESWDGDDSKEIYFRNVDDLRAQLDSPGVQDFLRKQLETVAPESPDGSCPTSTDTTHAPISTPFIGGSVTTSQVDGVGVTTSKPVETTEVTTDFPGTTKESHDTTEKPTTTAEATTATTDSQETTKESHDTTEKPTSTAEATTEFRDSAAEEEISTVTLTCPPLISNDTCKVIYDGKCFTWIIPKDQNVNLAKANKLCLDEGFQLGNIYDNCQYELITDKLVDELKIAISSQVWTGMTLDIESGKIDTAQSISGEDVTIFSDWWYPGYPNSYGGKYLTLKVSRLPPPLDAGIVDAEDSTLHGAFCERV